MVVTRLKKPQTEHVLTCEDRRCLHVYKMKNFQFFLINVGDQTYQIKINNIIISENSFFNTYR